MKTSLFYAILFVLTMGLTVACSNNEDISNGTQYPNDVSSQDQKDLSKLKANEPDPKTNTASEIEAAMSTRSADSHTHGDAELAVVLDGGTLTIEFETPLYNILGFEHSPDTNTQKARVTQAETELGQGDKIFIFNPEAKCEITSQNQTVTLFDDDNLGHENHDDHTNHHDHDDHDEDTHKDVFLKYEFLCMNSAALTNVSINLFEFFEELSEIDVIYLGPSIQRQVTLNRNNTRMDLSQ